MNFSQPLLALAAVTLLTMGCAQEAQEQDGAKETAPAAAPIINAHFHSARLNMDDAAYRRDVLQEMDEHNIAVSVLHLNEESDLEDWADHAPDRFLAGPSFPCWRDAQGELRSCNWRGDAFPDLDWLRENYASGRMKIMGEMFFVYAGISPTDERMAPYWALAEELDIPVGVHINRGPPPNTPSRPDGCCPDFNADLGDPALLRPVLEKHPNLKIWLQHAGFPAMPMFDNVGYLEETFALLDDYPHVYVDMTALNAAAPAPAHEQALRAFIERGFDDRIMFATDNWPAAPILERHESFTFLTDDQKRAIMHDNAQRFFDLKD